MGGEGKKPPLVVGGDIRSVSGVEKGCTLKVWAGKKEHVHMLKNVWAGLWGGSEGGGGESGDV